MIATEFYNGQGLGNQLWCYVTSRVLASKLGYEFSVISPERFKGHKLFALELGAYIAPQGGIEGIKPGTLRKPLEHYYSEARTYDIKTGLEISVIDPGLYKLPPNTKLDGNFQQISVIEDSKDMIGEWLKVDPPNIELGNTCVINFRGGEYFHHKNIFLGLSYWKNSIDYVKSKYPLIDFLVVTDDADLARKYFPGFAIGDFSMEDDYRCIAHARVLILSNSSFAWFPAWLNKSLELCVAPMYWWGFNSDLWSGSGVIAREWHYITKEGAVYQFPNSGNPEVKEKIYDGDRASIRTLTTHLGSNFALRLRLFGVRRRKSRAKVWLMIFLRKILSSFLINGIANNFKNFQQNLTYSRNEKKISSAEIFWRRKKQPSSKVIDLFLFYNELDLLELRLEQLWEFVDLFVICESSTTFTGITKESEFLLNKNRFDKYKSKIVHLQNWQYFTSEDDVRQKMYASTDSREREILSRCLTDPNVPQGAMAWLNEYYQKEIPITWISKLPDESVIIISDVDEIWDPKRLLIPCTDEILVFKQTPYVYFMNLESDEHWNNWSGSVSARAGTWKNMGINPMRTHRRLARRVIPKGGWHFSFQGGKKMVLAKLAAYGHQELNSEESRAQFVVSVDQITELRSIKPKLFKNDKLSNTVLKVFRSEHPDWFM